MNSLEEVGGVDDGSPPMSWTPIGVLQTSNRFETGLHFQARSFKKCYHDIKLGKLGCDTSRLGPMHPYDTDTKWVPLGPLFRIFGSPFEFVSVIR